MEKNNKYWLLAGLVLAVALWYLWDQVKEVASKTAAKVATLKTKTAAAAVVPTPGQTIAAASMQAPVKDNYYQYGSGQIYFDSFTNKLAEKSAFKPLN